MEPNEACITEEREVEPDKRPPIATKTIRLAMAGVLATVGLAIEGSVSVPQALGLLLVCGFAATLADRLSRISGGKH